MFGCLNWPIGSSHALVYRCPRQDFWRSWALKAGKGRGKGTETKSFPSFQHKHPRSPKTIF